MKNIYPICLLLLCFQMQAQMNFNGTIRYGNEWIRADQPYFKIPIAQDGIYRLSYETLAAAGIPVNTTDAAQYQLFHFGEEIPIYINKEGTLSNGDYIEFYGKKNRGELDEFMYKNGKNDMLNPEYSLITDTAAYFLTIAPLGTLSKRYQTLENNLTNLPPKEEWYWETILSNQIGGFVEYKDGQVSESTFEVGEGFGAEQSINQAFQVILSTDNRYLGAAADSFQIRLAGIGANRHAIGLKVNNNLINQKFGAGQNGFWEARFGSDLSATAKDVTIQLIDTTGRIAIGNIKVLYARKFNFLNRTQFYFKLKGTGNEQYLEVENFQHGNVDPILYDLTTATRIKAKQEAGKIRIKLEAFSGERAFYLVNPSSGAIMASIAPIIMNDITKVNKEAEFIIITSRKLRSEAVQAYAAYRREKYQVAVVEVEDLYEQFAYGVQRHPLAIRNFGHYVKQFWTNPKFVLILGKAQEFKFIRSQNASANPFFFVPTFGYPGSDNLLVADNAGTPILPIGRIAAVKASDIQMYLEKLKDYENPSALDAKDRSWRKEIIHLGGGKNPSEQMTIEGDMNRMSQIITNNSFGANVNTFYKKSTDATQRLNSERINTLLQQGVGIITFFGHGGPTIIDINIGEPSTFTNYRQYPIMFALGCDSGNIHLGGSSYSENFVFQPNRAGIAYVGTSSLGFSNDLGSFQQKLYDVMGSNQYGKSLGEALQVSIQSNASTLSKVRRTLLQQYTLHGDPALVLNPYAAPDYVVETESVKFSPSPVSIRQDSFQVSFSVLNIGKNINDSLDLKMTRRLPNGIQKTIPMKIKAPAFRADSLAFRFPVADSSGNVAGFNEFSVELDSGNKITELPNPVGESNNKLTDAIKLFIFDKGITPIAPLNYSIVNILPLKLQASTAAVFESAQRYRMSIDTSARFDSPFLRQDTLFTVTGGVLEWQPRLALQNNTVYYWRVALDSLIEGQYNWSSSSFTYIKDSSLGWRQGHFQQLQENDFFEMSLPDRTRQLTFASNPTDLQFTNFTYPGGGYLNYAIINNSINLYLGGIDGGGVLISVFNDVTGDPWKNPPYGRYGSVVAAEWATDYPSFPFPTRTAAARQKVINFLKDTIPDGHYVLLFTMQHVDSDYEPAEWAADSTATNPVNLFKLLESQGATKIRNTATSGARPYAIFYRKNKPVADPSLFFEDLADSVTDTISHAITVPGFKSEGSLVSRVIGPARKWTRLQQNFTTDEYDEFSVNLYGIRVNKTEALLLQNVSISDTTLEWINANEYPYLKLTLNAKDSVKRTPAQLDYWQVLYEGIPEAALNPLVASFQAPKDTLQEGETLEAQITISNLSNYDMDSLLVYYIITSETNQVRLDSVRLKPLIKQQNLVFPLKIATRGMRGNQRLSIEINPEEDQPELYQFNNSGELSFFVENDKRNPLLDVTFDGMRIMNGGLVSAKPQIVISLRDENLYLPLIDTSTVELWIQYPDQSTRKRISFNQVRFEPAKPGVKGSKATIYYEAEFTQDGTYTLYVNGRDASENVTANLEYQVEFEVITKSMISNVFNYPNPFTTSTQFVYTLTGAESPAHYKIQIMSVSGRVVRELTELDLGPLYIGTHRTELAWDGTDQYGDRLANGVYLYRVIAKNQDGKDYEKYDTDTNRFFKKNIGKLVILR